VERATVEIYEDRGSRWAQVAARRPGRRPAARAFAERVARGATRLDLGCGAGRYIGDLGTPVIGIDAARSMLEQCRETAPGMPLLQGDLEALPLRRGSIGGGWANMSYLHLPGVRLPMALAELHRVLVERAPVDLQVLAGDYEGDALEADEIGGRYFCGWNPGRLRDVTVGAGFSVEAVEVDGEVVRIRGERMRTLPDFVGPDMRLLFVGLNPSLFAADVGVGYARRSNRFWGAVMRSGVVTLERDPVHALKAHGVGMTDLVKRATVGAGEITAAEYREGLGRVERLVRWLEPQLVCMVGITGWKRIRDAEATPGLQEATLGSRPVYVMPSTSGANARASLEDLVEHLNAVVELVRSADRDRPCKHPA
jgi:TDG/mug DNA glycosylase family protein